MSWRSLEVENREAAAVDKTTGFKSCSMLGFLFESPDESELAQRLLKGSVKQKVEPQPGSDSTQIRPLWASTSLLHTNSPSPAPPTSSGLDSSRRWKGPNSLA